MWVTVRPWRAEDVSVISYKNEIYAPCVDADTCYFDAAFRYSLQPFDNLVIQGINVPVELSSVLNDVVREACDFLKFHCSVNDVADDGSAACSAQIHRKKILGLFHSFRFFNCKYTTICRIMKVFSKFFAIYRVI